jgi:predicted DNA-binding transcriptional regulator YafY
VFDAVVVADPEHAPYVRERRWHPSQKTRELPRGAVEFKLPFGDFGEAARWILGQGPGFKPIAPKGLVEDWRRQVRALRAWDRR